MAENTAKNKERKEIDMTVNEEVRLLCTNAKEASQKLALASTEEKNEVLLRIAEKLQECKEELIAANEKDIAAADANGVPKTMLDRLKINSERIDAICASLADVAALEDPVGKGESWTRPSGLDLLISCATVKGSEAFYVTLTERAGCNNVSKESRFGIQGKIAFRLFFKHLGNFRFRQVYALLDAHVPVENLL